MTKGSPGRFVSSAAPLFLTSAAPLLSGVRAFRAWRLVASAVGVVAAFGAVPDLTAWPASSGAWVESLPLGDAFAAPYAVVKFAVGEREREAFGGDGAVGADAFRGGDGPASGFGVEDFGVAAGAFSVEHPVGVFHGEE